MHKTHCSILLVDDHPVFRKGMRSLLEDEEDLQVVGEAGDGRTALKLIQDLSPDIIVMDVTMPELNGIEATRRIVSEYHDTKVVALSIHAEKQFVKDMLQAGAAGYMLKDSGAEELVKGIRAIMAGEGYLSPAITGLVVSEFRESVTQELSLKEVNYEIPETKFYVPSLPADHVRRPRLLERLETNHHLSVQCIIAPAGYGKTTLVSDWLTRHQRPNAWVSLDEDDNDLRKFTACFVRAVQTILPSALSKSEAFVRAGKLPPIQALAATLVNELILIQDDFILVFDDFHVIREKSVHDLLAEIFRYPPTVMHIVVISRTDPFLPLPRLRAHNHLAEIRLNDLRFTQDETAAFLKSIFDQDIKHSIASSLNKKTEGWVTGLRLAVLSTRHQDDLSRLLQDVHGSGHYIKEYLFNEVLARQPENIRKHITVISILERFCAPLFDVLCPNTNGECKLGGWGIIKWLKKNGLFQIPLDNEGRWFRFHHLFQELLQGQLKRTYSAEEINAFHLKAGIWFAENGYTEEALTHILAAGKPEQAGELVAQLGHTLIDQERVVELELYLRKLPQEVVTHNPLLLIFEAWIARVKLMVPKIAENLIKVEEILRSESLAEPLAHVIWGYFHTIRSYERYCMLDHKEALSCAQHALKQLPPEYPYMRAFASIVQAAALQMTGSYQDALSIMKLAQSDPGLQRNQSQAVLLAGLAPICMMEADEFKLQTVATRLLKLGNKTNLPAYRSWGRLYLACSNYLRNDLEQAEGILDAHLEDRYLMYPDVVIDGAVILAFCRQQLGRPEDACEVAALLDQHALETNHPGLLMAAQAFQAELALLQERLDEAIAWTRVFEPRKLHAHYFFFLPELTLAKILIAEDTVGSCQKAQNLLSDMEQFSRSTCNRSVIIPTLLLQAMVLYSQNQPASLEKAAEAVSIAATGGGLRFFLDFGLQLKDILMQMQQNNVPSAFVDQIVAGFHDLELEKTQIIPSQETGEKLSPDYPGIECLREPLTDREQEILKQLVKGRSNKEISEHLFISIDTVKSHLKNIYQKLDVKSRLQAVAKATEIGVIGAK